MRKNSKQQIQMWAMLCHLSGLLWIPLLGIVLLGIPLYLPFLNILGPLIIWLWKKKKDPWIDFQGREALNFQLSLTVYALLVIVISLFWLLITFVIAMTTHLQPNLLSLTVNTLLTFFIMVISSLMIIQSFLVSFAAVKAYKGYHFRYPFTIRFLQ
jgi:uncharacterized Tic20 family protein